MQGPLDTSVESLSRGPSYCLETLGTWLDGRGRMIRQVPGGQAQSRGKAHMVA